MSFYSEYIQFPVAFVNIFVSCIKCVFLIQSYLLLSFITCNVYDLKRNHGKKQIVLVEF